MFLNKYSALILLCINVFMGLSQIYSEPHATVHNAIYIDTLEIQNIVFSSNTYENDCGNTKEYELLSNNWGTLTADSTYVFDFSLEKCGSTFYNSGFQGWIDYNNNGIFEDVETVFYDDINQDGNYLYPFTIPADANDGGIRVRIKLEKDGVYPLNPDGDISVGYILDFNVYIVLGECATPSNLQVNTIGTTSLDLGYHGSGQATVIDYTPIGNSTATDSTIVVWNTNFPTLSGLSMDTPYEICIRSVCNYYDTTEATCILAATNGMPLYTYPTDLPCENFVDISSTGTNLSLLDGQNIGLSLPFTFKFQGQVISDITVGHDGAIILGTQSGTIGSDMASSTQNGFFVFSQALTSLSNGANVGGVFYETIGNFPNRKFVVQWKDMGFVTNTQNNGDRIDFEFMLDEASGKSYFLYDDVIFSNPIFDYGKSAEIGVRGPINDYDISLNDTTFLKNNSCIVFEASNCDEILNLEKEYISETVTRFKWSNVVPTSKIEYGPTGFNVGSGSFEIEFEKNYYDFEIGTGGIVPATEYDVYVRSVCSIVYLGAVAKGTLDFVECVSPNFIDLNVEQDSLFIALDNSNTTYDYTNEIHYRYAGDTVFSVESIVGFTQNNITTDTIIDPSLNSPFLLEVCVNSQCSSQGQYIATSDLNCYPDPIPAMTITNTTPATSTNVSVNGSVISAYNQNVVSTPISAQLANLVSTVNAQSGWNNSIAASAVWFNFVAPTSGSLIVDATGIDHLNKSINQPINIANKAAVYSTTDVTNPNAFTLVSANDNSIIDTSLNSFDWTICNLIPGNTYYLMYSDDDSTSNGGAFSLRLTDTEILNQTISLNGAIACLQEESISLNSFLTSYPSMEGVWRCTDSIINTSIIGSNLIVDQLVGGIYQFVYNSNIGCASDTIDVLIQLESPPFAGDDGSLTEFLNCSVNLYSGLLGAYEIGGTWYDVNGNEVANGVINTGSIPGQYNYTYIVEGVACESDPSVVYLTVDASYDCFSGLEDLEASIKFWPNPACRQFYLFCTMTGEELIYRIYDTKGCGLQGEYFKLPSNEIVEVDVQDLSPGVYFIEITNGTHSSIQRLVIE